MGYSTENITAGDIGETLSYLEKKIQERSENVVESSYTCKLLNSDPEYLLKKISEESTETILAAVGDSKEHLRYEIADLVYHLLVLMNKANISVDELAGELNARKH